MFVRPVFAISSKKIKGMTAPTTLEESAETQTLEDFSSPGLVDKGRRAGHRPGAAAHHSNPNRGGSTITTAAAQRAKTGR